MDKNLYLRKYKVKELSTTDKNLYLKKYKKDAAIIESGIEEIEDIPQAWKDILHVSDTEEKINEVLALWKTYAYPVLSNTISYLEKNLLNVELIGCRGRYSLLYSIKQPNGNVAYYEGGNPREHNFPDEVQKRWKDFPTEIKIFYENLHNGFFLYASGSMGIVPLDDSFGIFSSGMGGYVTVDLSDCDNGKATLWFAGRQPQYDLNFWDLVDERMVIGFQC